MLLKVENLSCGYEPDHMIIKNLSFELNYGEHLWVKGKNGAGKSTLFKAIMGQMPYVTGKIYFEGKDITNLPTYKISRLGIGWMMQTNNVFKNISHLESGKLYKIPLVRISHEHSTGEVQFSNLVSFLDKNFVLFLFDEPLAALSYSNEEKVNSLLDTFFQKKQNETMILINHRNNNHKSINNITI